MISVSAQYDALCDASPHATIFCRRWWLETVAPGQVHILTVESGGVLQAAWPITITSVYGISVIKMPPLTPWLGIIIGSSTAQKLSSHLSQEFELIDRLVEQLPRFGYLRANFHRAFQWWMPLHWHGFEQTTRYTYVIEDLSRPEVLWNNLSSNTRKNIRKAEKEGIAIEVSEDVDEFWRLHEMTFKRQRLPVPYSLEMVRRIDRACRERGVRRISLARGPDKKLHAAAYLVWDEKSAYYLMGGGHPDLRTSGAHSLLMWEAIQFAATVTKAFDFEGSMMKAVERFFRGFGGRPCPYSAINKCTSALLKTYFCARDLTALARSRLGREGR